MIEKFLTDQFQTSAAKIGLVLMASAAMLSSVEMSDGRERVVLVQPGLAFAPVENKVNNPDTNLRQERNEETGTHYVSYGTLMRTQSRAAGKQ